MKKTVLILSAILILLSIFFVYLVDCKRKKSRFSEFRRGVVFCAEYNKQHGYYPSYWLQKQVFQDSNFLKNMDAEDSLRVFGLPLSNFFGSGHGLDTFYITDDLYLDTSTMKGYTAIYDSLGNVYLK